MQSKKQRIVIAIVVQEGKVVSCATNEHKDCKRIGYPTGEGYDLCKGCQYENHAEFKAVKGLKGGTVYLIGHTYACEPCKKAITKAQMELEIINI